MTLGGLIVGVGHPDRGDDAAGIHAVRRLDAGHRVREVTDCSTLLDMWADESDVTVIDATVSGAAPGTIITLDGLRETLPAGTTGSTHSFGLAQSVELGRALDRLPDRLTIHCIEGERFDHGQPMSPVVDRAVDTLVARLATELS